MQEGDRGTHDRGAFPGVRREIASSGCAWRSRDKERDDVLRFWFPAVRRQDNSRRLSVPVVNEDGGPVATTFVKLLRERADVSEVTRAEAEAIVRDRHESAAAIVFPCRRAKGL